MANNSTSNASRQQALSALRQHHAALRQQTLSSLFAEDSGRFASLHRLGAGILLDFSKNHLTSETLSLLVAFAESCELPRKRSALLAGEPINTTEQRPALHTALRRPATPPLILGDLNVTAAVSAGLRDMERLAAPLRAGQWLGASGQAITDVVHMGIGGSDLGPQLALEALRGQRDSQLRIHFVANIDGDAISQTIAPLNPHTTLFVVASKSFTTLETLANAEVAKQWLGAALGADAAKALQRHFIGISANVPAAKAFGLDAAHVLPFWEWVGGRTSLWSAIGFPVALGVGMPAFRQLLAGAHAMDEHFAQAPLQDNLPVLLALVGFWYRAFYGTQAHAVVPYAQNLARLPAYLQQLEMESNGKGVALDGSAVDLPTAPVIFGDAGTNAQHAFFQMLHQGTDLIPCDFIAVAKAHHPHPQLHQQLLANFLAQTEALLRGKSQQQVEAELAHLPAAQRAALAPHKVFPGNRPSTSIVLKELSPQQLGALLALYEHKTFCQGVFWDINSFDQWGVELGKVLAKEIMPSLAGSAALPAHYSTSTRGLLAYLQQ